MRMYSLFYFALFMISMYNWSSAEDCWKLHVPDCSACTTVCIMVVLVSRIVLSRDKIQNQANIVRIKNAHIIYVVQSRCVVASVTCKFVLLTRMQCLFYVLD